MLSMKKCLSSTTRYSSCCANPVLSQYIFGSEKIRARGYSKRVPESWLMDDEDKERYKIDKSIMAVSRKLIYCDAIEKKSLRGHPKKVNKRYGQLKYRAKQEKLKNLMEKPAFSVVLKYLRPSEDNTEKVVNKEDKDFSDTRWNETSQPGEKPIYMPYAATDSYEPAELSPSTEDPAEIPVLNEEYITLYEKYLETTKSSVPDDLEKILSDKDSTIKITPGSKNAEASVVPPNWMTDYEQYEDDFEEAQEGSLYGTPDPRIPVSSVPCGGCGALLHCQDPAIPGYLPSELFKNQTNDILRSTVCQRCHFMKMYNTTLNITVSPDEYPALFAHIKKTKVAIIMMVDLTDFPCSIWPGIVDIVNKNTPIFVVGNKVDLLPSDGPNYLKNIEQSLRKSISEMGINNVNIKHVSLISAKTGYGVEQLINKLHQLWEYKGDVYLIGCTNVGKSSLFNALLQSDYCKIQAADLIQRATISPWPGTTLNLLKFPILNPVRKKLWERTQRLIEERESVMSRQEDRIERYKTTGKIKFTTLQGHIGRSFESLLQVEGAGYFGHWAPQYINTTGRLGYNDKADIYKHSRWCYDTPGALLHDQILHFLTTEELMLTLSRRIISPRTFLLKGGQTLFLAGLGRLDLSQDTRYIGCTVFACPALPVTICYTDLADEIYQKLLKTEAFVVPKNDPERLKIFPALESKSFETVGIGWKESVADVILSSAGWIAVTASDGIKMDLRAWTPEGKGIYLRTPAMLSRAVNFKGTKIPNSPLFARGREVYVNKQ